MISAKLLPSNQRPALTRNVGKIKPMKKWIKLNSFCAVSFDVFIRQTPVSAMHNAQPKSAHRPILVQRGSRPVAILLSVVFVETSSYTKTGAFN